MGKQKGSAPRIESQNWFIVEVFGGEARKRFTDKARPVDLDLLLAKTLKVMAIGDLWEKQMGFPGKWQ